jgi:alpha-beta hydrolase superfamily lysophospholipase
MSERVELLKTDVRGRVRVPDERREALLNEFEKSGLSGPKFAMVIGVKYQTFAWWVQQRRQRKEREKQAAATPQAAGAESAKTATAVTPLPALKWIEASVEPASASKRCDPVNATALPVLLPGGARMEITNAGQVELAAQLLQRLR